MAKIHPSSVVESSAILAPDVEVGPLCYIGPHVRIGAGTRLIAQCHIDGYTTLGERNTVYPFCALGREAQDHSVVPGAPTYLEIGDDNIFREGFTAHTGALPETKTVIGSRNMFMNCSHIAHNNTVGNDVIVVGLSGVAGHCHIYDHAIISGVSGLHQFCRVGRYAIISGGSVFSQDIPPFMMAEGRNGGVKMINLVGLKRGGFSAESIQLIKQIYRIYYREGLIPSLALEKIRTELPPTPEVVEFLDFCKNSKKGVLAGHAEGHRA